MSAFPLYDTILANLQHSTSSSSYPQSQGNASIDKVKILKYIQIIDQDGRNKLYALIRFFAINHNANETEIIPFGGYYLNDELIFDLDKMPCLLQQIIQEFVQIHIKHMKSLQKIEKIRKKSNDNK